MLRGDTRRAQIRAPTSDRPFASKALSKVRALLAALAEIDHAYAIDLETVKTSDAPLSIKQNVMDTLRRQHQERRALYIRKLRALQAQERRD